jgi:hypothetical protein
MTQKQMGEWTRKYYKIISSEIEIVCGYFVKIREYKGFLIFNIYFFFSKNIFIKIVILFVFSFFYFFFILLLLVKEFENKKYG